MQGIAVALGARTEIIDDLGAIGAVLERALAHAGPSFLLIDREP
jgi:benzoylformate decarboxylase